MIRCIKLKLIPQEPKKVLKTMRVANLSFNDCAKIGFREKTSSKNKLHHLTYYKIRKKYPNLPSSLVQTIRDTVCEALKGSKLRIQPKKKQYSSVRYDKRTANIKLDKGEVSLSTIKGRVKGKIIIPEYFKQYLSWTIGGCTLQYKNSNFYLNVFVKQDTPKLIEENKVLGIDRGINNVAVYSDNSFTNSKNIHRVKGNYAHLRKELQAKGTRSAKRKLKKLSGSEKRFVRNESHIIVNEIVKKPFDVFALEDLTHIRVQKRLGKSFNRKLSNWNFYELEQILAYKAENLGKQIIKVDARYSSQKCSRCGHIERSNRNLSEFCCKKCGFKLHADLNAARNIAQAGISGLSRLQVNQPNVALKSCPKDNDENEVVTSPRHSE
jgi:putative transposase